MIIFATFITVMLHLLTIGLLCWAVDEINPEYTYAVFMTYFTTVYILTLHNLAKLTYHLKYNREELLNALKEIEEEK